jgi:hypothetical protein
MFLELLEEWEVLFLVTRKGNLDIVSLEPIIFLFIINYNNLKNIFYKIYKIYKI